MNDQIKKERKVRHSYGCVKEVDMALLKKAPKTKATVESILGHHKRSFAIIEVDHWTPDEDDKSDWDWMDNRKRKMSQYKQKVMVDMVTGTMYDFFTKQCMSSTRLRIID